MSRRINPYRLFLGAHVPNWLLERPEVSEGAKLTYARLMQHGGKEGNVHPSQAALAEELGISLRHVQRHLRDLIRHGLIEQERPGLGMVNRYYFLDHPWFSHIRHDKDVASDTTGMSPQETTALSSVRESVEENQEKRESTLAPVTLNGVIRTPDGSLSVESSLLEAWQKRFPLIDVPAWVEFMGEYAAARPLWAHSRRNWRLTVLRWLKAEQEKAASRGLARPDGARSLEERKEQLRQMLRRARA